MTDFLNYENFIHYCGNMNKVATDFLANYHTWNHIPYHQLNETFNMNERLSGMIKDVYTATDAKLRCMYDINVRLLGKRFATDPILGELHGIRQRIIGLIVQHHRSGITLDESYKPSGGLRLGPSEFALKYLAERNKVARSLRLLQSEGF